MNKNKQKYSSDYDNNKYDKYNTNTDGAIKTTHKFERVVDIEDVNDSREKSIMRNIIENPDVPMKINEDDIYNAMRRSGSLPEDELRDMVAEITEKNVLLDEVDYRILDKLHLFLNKSIAEICKIGKKSKDLRAYDTFWYVIEKEVDARRDSLTNDQLTDIVSSFGKAEAKDLKIFEYLEDSVIETEIPFLPDQLERIFYAYCEKKQGSTAFLKYTSRKYFKNKNIIDSWRIAKYIVELHKHPQNIKSSFGFVSELEDQIQKELNNKTIKFEHLITLAELLFTNNLCSNQTQLLIENALIEKFGKDVEIDIGRIIKLVKSLAHYYIKNDLLCHKIKNHIETYLNGYISQEKEISGNNNNNNNLQTADKSKDKDYTDEEENNYDYINRQPNNINYDFSRSYIKLLSQLNIIIWSFSKNKKFLSFANDKHPEFQYFYQRLKETFLKNINSYNERETVFTLEGIVKLTDVKENENNLIIEKVDKLNSFIPHETIKLLKLMMKNNIGSSDNVDKLINLALESYSKLTYSDLIDFINIFYNFPILFHKIFDENKIKIFEDRLINILGKIDIPYLSKVVILSSKLNGYIGEKFQSVIEEVINLRLNEIPKENFASILYSATNLKLNDTMFKFVDILEDLSNFENLKDLFNNPEERLNLLWSSLSILLTIDKGNSLQRNLLNKYMELYINKDNYFDVFLKEDINFELFFTDNLHERELTLTKYLQTVYLSFIYMKQKYNFGELELEEINSKLAIHLNNIDPGTKNNYINLDAASKCNSVTLQDIQREVLIFFQPKVNASIYPNFMDEIFNPINIIINFEKPTLKNNEVVTGIDAKKYGIIILNKYYVNSKGNYLTIYENRIKILKEVFDWEIIEIDQSQWEEESDKQEFLTRKFGFDFKNEENTRLNLDLVEEGKEIKKSPRFKLTKSFLSKK